MDLSRFRLMTLLAVAVLLLGFATGCGDDSGGDSSGGSAAPSGGSDEQQVRSVVEGLYEDLANYDAEAVCARMSPAAQKQIAAGAIGPKAKHGATCAKSFGNFLDLAKRQGGLKQTLTAEVGKVEIDGSRALATVSFGQQSGQIPLRKIRGDWKMGVSVATPSVPPPTASSKKK